MIQKNNMFGLGIALLIIIVLWSLWGYFGSRVEQAEYTVVKKMRGYEIRNYPSHIVAQTTVDDPSSYGLNLGFSIVASYIFGANEKREYIAMTAPVLAEKDTTGKSAEKIAMTAPVVSIQDGKTQTISFGMPRSHSLETLPKPTDTRVKIVVMPEKKYAVMRFSWYRSDARIKNMLNKLLAALSRDGIETEGGPAYAGYNAPWTPPWMIRNEVMFILK